MTRDELSKNIQEILDTEILPLFTQKNQSYGISEDGFWNFRKAADIIYGSGDTEYQFNILMAYVMKHILALTNKNIYEPEFRSRCKDIIVYMLIAMSMEDDLEFKGVKG